MNLKVYEKTRYQNIYRHKKNKNYLVAISKPVKTTIATVDSKKIITINEALKIRDNSKIKQQKGISTIHKEDFDFLIDKYLDYCKKDIKNSYNTLKKKKNLYYKYFKNQFGKISSVTKDIIVSHINNLSCSDKQKNELLDIIRPFFNWCVNNDIIFKSPIAGVKHYKVVKSEMKYWLPEHIKTILYKLNYDIENEDLLLRRYYAYLVKMVIVIGFALGDRIGETRALRFIDIIKDLNCINIKHSINYNPNDPNYLSPTKTDNSSEVVYVTPKVIEEIEKFKDFLINVMEFEVTDLTPILYNFNYKRPYSDTRLRQLFNEYIEITGVPKIRMYDLRHTTATTLMAEGYDMYIIKDKLRHKSIRTTIDEYGHITLNKRKEVATITDKYI